MNLKKKKKIEQLDSANNDSNDWRRRRIILEVLFYLVINQDGYKTIEEELEKYRKSRNEKYKYQFLCESLRKDTGIEYKINCLRLLNNLIETPEEVFDEIEHPLCVYSNPFHFFSHRITHSGRKTY